MTQIQNIIFIPGRVITLIGIFIIIIFRRRFYKRLLENDCNNRAMEKFAEQTYPFTVVLSLLFYIWILKILFT